MAISPYVRDLRIHVGHELLMLPSVSAVLLNDAGELLLAQRRDNERWSLIAGAIDPGEQPADAIVREIHEESGVRAVVERVTGVALHPVTYPNGDVCQYLNIWFRCRAVGGQAQVNDDESLAVAWFAADSLPEIDELARLRIDVALNGENAAWFAKPGEYHKALA